MTGEAYDPDQALRLISGLVFSEGIPRKLGVAVSGGGDSMALLDLMLWHGRDKGFAVEAVTIDHGLRPEAGAEAAEVHRFCAGRDVPHETIRWTGPDGTGNLQAMAREARYRLIADWASRRGIGTVVLGHTQDDQAETFLMRLARASGVDGLAAMDSRFDRHGLTWRRPLLNFSRAELRDYLMRRDIAWAEDPSNEDESFDRVKARRVLEALDPLGIDAETLSRVASNLSLARSALETTTREIFRSIGREDRGDIVFDREALRGRQPEYLRRLLNAGLQFVASSDYPPRRETILSSGLPAMVRGTTATLLGCVVYTARSETRITREHAAVRDLATPTDALWDGRWRLEGPHAPDLEIRALGEAVKDCPGWRETGMPRQSLLASPAVWRGSELIAAPVAGLGNGWTASADGRGTFSDFLLRR